MTLLFKINYTLAAEKFAVIGIIAIVVAVIVFLAIYFSRRNKVLRALKKFKAKRIMQFRTNEPTKITGKVLHVHEPFLAPVTKRKCVAYHFKIEQLRSTGKSSHWKTILSEHDIQDFFIEERGEVVMVKPTKQPKNYESYMVKDGSSSSSTFREPSPDFQRVLDHYGINSKALFGFNKRLRYSERIIEVGEEITVGGIAKWKESTQPLNEYGSTRIATLESSAEQQLVITDDPKAKTDLRSSRF